MRHVGAFTPFHANPLAAQAKTRTKVDYSPEGTHRATVDDIDEIIDYLNVSNIFPAVGGLYYAGFVGYEITAELLEKHIAAPERVSLASLEPSGRASHCGTP